MRPYSFIRTCGGSKGAIVDQPRVFNPHGQRGQDAPVNGLDRQKRIGVNQSDVVDSCVAGRFHDRPHLPQDRGRVALAAANEFRGQLQALPQHARLLRATGLRYAFRELIASPSASRTVGQTRTSTGMFRSSTMRWMTATCWQSFWPKYAASGPTI